MLTIFHKITIQVKHFPGIRWLFFMKSQFRPTISWEFVDFFHGIAIQVKHFMGMYWLFFMKSRFRSTISWEFVDCFSWNHDSGQTFSGNVLTVNCRITNQVKQSARICWLYSMKSQFKMACRFFKHAPTLPFTFHAPTLTSYSPTNTPAYIPNYYE